MFTLLGTAKVVTGLRPATTVFLLNIPEILNGLKFNIQELRFIEGISVLTMSNIGIGHLT